MLKIEIEKTNLIHEIMITLHKINWKNIMKSNFQNNIILKVKIKKKLNKKTLSYWRVKLKKNIKLKKPKKWTELTYKL